MSTREYEQHPFGKVWENLQEETFTELKRNIAHRGLDQLIVLYQGMILEGWHRYLACLATNTEPRFIEFKGNDLAAAELVHASGIRRHSTPEQRYAAFCLLCKACSEFAAKYEKLKEEGKEHQQAGKPLATDDQRVDVLQAKADAAGVSKSTAKKIEKLEKMKPEVLPDLAAGKTTTNKELRKLQEKLSETTKSKKGRARQASQPREKYAFQTQRNTEVTFTARSQDAPDLFIVGWTQVRLGDATTSHNVRIECSRKHARRLYRQLWQLFVDEGVQDDEQKYADQDGTNKRRKTKQPKRKPS